MYKLTAKVITGWLADKQTGEMRLKMKQYTYVTLKTGEPACIVEVLEDGKAYLADVDHEDGSTTTDFVAEDQIESILR